MATLQTINLNVLAQPMARRLQTFLLLSQNENGRVIRCRILGTDIPSGSTATFAGVKPDGNTYSAVGTVDGNYVSFDETLQMTAVAGMWDAKLDIVNGDDNIMTSVIRVVVDVDPSADGVESDSELEGIIAQAKYYAEQARSSAYGSPLVAETAAEMIDTNKVYVYTGSETGYTNGNWYYYDTDTSTWTSGGVYNESALNIDSALSASSENPVKNSVIATAINATNTNVSANTTAIGTLANLTTTEKTNLVGAINEIDADVSQLNTELTAIENGNCYINAVWEQGAIDNSGTNIDSNATIRTADYIDLSTDYIHRIITASSISVAWYWYDANKTYLSKGSATINGTYELALSANASYVRFDAVTLNSYNVKIAKDAQAVVVDKKATAIAEAHNQIANGLCEFVCPLQRGILNTSTGAEVVNNLFVRTDYINISDYKIIGYYAPVDPGLNVIEYASDKTFVNRTLYSATGIVNINFNDATVYVRYTWFGNRTLKILQSVPFMMDTEKQQIIDRSKLEIANIKNLSEQCIHHDNFSRTESGYDIGKNSEDTLTDNSYDTVTGASSDDGVRVDDGLTISADNTRADVFTVRKINTAHSANFMVEFNAPANNQGVYIIYELTDANNFTAINISYNGTYYSCIQRTIANGSFKTTIDNKNVYDTVGYVVRLYFLGGVIAIYIDDKYCYSFYANKVDDYLYIGSYRNVTAHFDFINVFDLIPPLVWDSEYLTDDGVSELPNSTISANANRYALDAETTRFSNRSEHFMLYSTDEKINNGRRTERSLVALLQGNLRTMRYEFDVLFPSGILPDTATGSYGDIFFQLHDRQTGVSRGHVPFDLELVGNEIHLSQYYSSEQASSTLAEVVSDLNLGEVTYNKWMHFEIFIKERYEETQHPFIEIKIDGSTVYQSRKPNCANDVKGASAQYGEYKNNWDLITYSERYFDNFKVTY